MAREIKFRAWDKKTKNMYQDVPLITLSSHVKEKDETLNKSLASFQTDSVGFVLMQYTGLKDKSGKEIYEGDILKYLANYPIDYQIKYPHKKHGRIGNGVKYKTEWGCFLLDDTFEKEEVMCGFKENEQWEIIGNIYENPELLNNK